MANWSPPTVLNVLVALVTVFAIVAVRGVLRLAPFPFGVILSLFRHRSAA